MVVVVERGIGRPANGAGYTVHTYIRTHFGSVCGDGTGA